MATFLAAACLATGFLSLTAAAQAAPTGGFLDDRDLTITRWLSPAPRLDSGTEVGDLSTYFETRSLVGGPRGARAHEDDVYTPEEVAPRFAPALGVTLTDANALVVLTTIHLAQTDLEALVKPLKKPRASGGRTRPYVQFPDLPACPHDVDDSQYGLALSGSYPSTHAALGMLWALILGELAPDRADDLLAEGYAFGESRLVCGFHYPSDLAAGRVAAAALVSRLHANPGFLEHMAAAKAQLDQLRGVAAPADAKRLTPMLGRVLKSDTARTLPPLSPER